jgi:hypothetical protein
LGSTSSKRYLYGHIRENFQQDGDIFEFGVYRGSSLLAIALLLKELGSNKRIFGFDSFTGFPSFSEEDAFDNFYKYPEIFTQDFVIELDSFMNFSKYFNGSKDLNEITLAESLDFSSNNIDLLRMKIEYLGLDNITLIEGDFESTVPDFFENYNGKVLACNIDSDLYRGYELILPKVWNTLSDDGYIHLDEYYSFKYPGAKIACDRFSKIYEIPIKRHEGRSGEFPRFYITKS